MGVLLDDDPKPTKPAAPAPKKGGLIDAGPKPIGHVTTPFVDPKRKPFFDTTAADAEIDKRAAKLGGAITGAFRATQVPQAFVESKLGGHDAIMRALNASNIGVLPTSLEDVKHFGERVGRPTPIGPVGEAAEGVLTDPLAPLGMPVKGLSTAARATTQVEKHGLPLAMKAGALVNKIPGGEKATGAVAGVHDVLGVHSRAKRAITQEAMDAGRGTDWLENYADMRARYMRASGEPEAPIRALSPETLKGKGAGIGVGSKGGTLKPMTDVTPPRADTDWERSWKLAFPDSPVPYPRDSMRPAHVPLEIPLGQRASRDAGGVGIGSKGGKLKPMKPVRYEPPKPPELDKPFVRERKFSPNEDTQRIFDLMDHPTPWLPGGIPRPPSWANAPADVLTAGMFAQPFGHMANIGFLGLLADPGAAAGALTHGAIDNAKKLVGKGETSEQIAARQQGARLGGALSSHSTERDNILTAGLGKAAEAAQKVPIAGQALAMLPKSLQALYRASGDVLWKFDDEVKARRFDGLVKGGMKPEMAGLRVGGELVDYENKSPAARALRPIMPFSTWRTKAPLAVGRNALENPGRANALARSFPAAMGGTQGQDPDSGQPFKSSLPGAEFAELTSGAEGAKKYAAGGFGPIPRYLAAKTNQLLSLSPRNPREEKRLFGPTYGKNPETFLLNESPLIGQLLQLSGNGMFSRGQTPSALTDLLSLFRVHP